jgi:enolase-phosphatase E1
VRLLDIEGTVCPVSFVHEVLFPWARERLPSFVSQRREDPSVVAVLEEVSALEPGDPVETLLRWMAEDRKITPLKTLQGLIWRQGYEEGALLAPLYEDVLPALARWRAAGEPVAVFSSGSVEAQRLLFGHTRQGDLLEHFVGFFDTTMGSKKEPGAYLRIAERCGVAAREVTFYSDVTAELDGALAAGMRTAWVVREGEPGGSVHRSITSLRGE